MNRVRQILLQTASYLDLPPEIAAGIPKIELTGFEEFCIEPHKGLLEYENEQIGVETILGKVYIFGSHLTIKLMNKNRIAIKGNLLSIQLGMPGE